MSVWYRTFNVAMALGTGLPPEEDDMAKSDRVLAAMSRLSLRKWRNTGDQAALAAHKEARAEMERRGLTDRFGVYGWDDGHR